MYFKLSDQQESELLNLPETGMGYQVIEATKFGSYNREKYLVLNSELVIEMNNFEADYVKKVVYEGISSIKAKANILALNSINVLSEKQFRNIVSESKNENDRGAIENPEENANGEEFFVRLSAFDNDRRIDKVNMCLRPGSFTTTMDDYLKCKASNDDPVERYALPKNDKIQFAFHIKPKKTDTLQRGTVKPAYGKRGGGKEAYFAKGTASGTFIKQTPY
ncbi:MAG TPA: hypothetical protein PLG57_01650 [Bacteroidia bacterium]|nr:hypothetical protein [Bacteroidia bacterium]HQF27847.1 hypothetical protein [Bacteroidia bacterium]HQK97821.1 hypothetical protein [Bacteroidia bacterium]